MKQKPISLRQFIKTFPESSFYNRTPVRDDIVDDITNISHEEKVRLCEYGSIYTSETLKVTDNTIFYGHSNIRLRRVGKRFFLKSTPIGYIYIIDGKVKVAGIGIDLIMRFLKLCNITWAKDLNPIYYIHYFIKPSILRDILTKRIYNEETLCKAISNKIYGIKDVSWRTIRAYITKCDRSFNFIDLYYYTKDINKSIEILSESESKWEARFTIYYEILNYAIKLNQIVDFNWSNQRLREEHQKQIERYNTKLLDTKNKAPIYKDTINNSAIKQLNTEFEIFEEGTNMHHCLYTCYYDRIKAHNYIAFHMYTPEDCTFSVKKANEDELIFDQIYMKYNKPVSQDTRELALTFVTQNYDRLLKMMHEPIASKPEYTPCEI